jgi:Putative DNA-binding domain
MDWPPDWDQLSSMLISSESTHLERKREWYDLADKGGKAEFAKDVLAMANATSADAPGHIVIGVEDEKAGGRVVGVQSPPTSEQLQQILTAYTSPVPELHCADIPYGDKMISVLRVVWTPFHPYYANRDHDRVLDSRSVYMRRGNTIVHLRPRELEDLIRQKGARVGSPVPDIPLRIGFVECESDLHSRVVARIANVTEEPVAGVTIIWELRLAARPGSIVRRRSRADYPMKPREVIEMEIDPRKQRFWYDGKSHSVDDPATIDRWLDIRLCVQYRDADGFIQEANQFLTLSD